MASASEVWQGFRHWRRRRPFWGGLLLLLSGAELFFSANQTVGDLQVHVGPQGFLSYLLPLVLLLCGLLVWFTPAQRLFYGIIGLLASLYSMIGLNLGGFFLGMLIGIIGGALVLAWVPLRPRPAEPAEDAAAGDSEFPPAPEDEQAPDESPFVPGFAGSSEHPAGAPDETAVLVDPRTPEMPETEAPTAPGSGFTRKAFVIGLVPLLATAAVLFGSSRTPARADSCAEGLPSRSVAATTSAATSAAAAAKKKTATPKQTTAGTTVKKSTAPSPSASTAAADDDEESDPSLLDDIKNGVGTVVDGVGKLLGVGDDPSASPSASASPSVSPSPSTPAPTTPGPTTSTGSPAPSATPGGSSAPAGSASPSPTPTSSDIPCLGPRVQDKVASPDDVPTVSVNGGLLEGDKLTMYNSTYDGVATLQTATGTVDALKFSMTKSVTESFSLDIPEAGGARTLIRSNTLTTDGDVRFYTPRFQGKLFGVYPVVFTPEEPPPLTLPILWFTDVKIQLSFVRCDTLTADPLDLTEPSA